ncbi:DUF3224 domain-containing protein [Sciscionella marina]|uniref:DUF3224 domain-containing protein n=1 Tax=Sciscionella marina TaxID=508770 RepID=UPI00037BCD99|nr:DUF3224 domain-containing protein [Sciscionella marina]
MASTKAKLTHSDWQESKSCEAEGHALAPMHCRYHYTGPVDGESTFEGVICYLGDTGSYTGYELFTGSIEGRRGTCVLRSVGGFAPDAVDAELEVVPDSGTGGLTGLRGGGRMRFPMDAEQGTIELDWILEA